MTAAKPQVHVIGTGGSIAGIGPDRLDYILYSEIGDHLTIEQSLERVPEIRDIASVTSEDLVSVGSTAIGPAEWLALTNRINGMLRDNGNLSGIAVTHGTATLEETSYFLHLTVKSDKPVVVTGAMRPPDGHQHRRRPESAGRGTHRRHCPRRWYGRADRAEQRDSFRPRRLQVQHFPRRNLPAQRARVSGLCRLRRPSGVLPLAAPQAHHRHALRCGGPRQPAPSRDCLRLRWGRRGRCWTRRDNCVPTVW